MKREITQVLNLLSRASSESVKRTPVEPKRQPPRLTPEQNQQIRELYEDGMTPKRIATSIGLSEWTIHHRLNRMGVKRRPALSDEQLERAIELRIQGWTYDDIAKEVGSSYGTIRSRLILSFWKE